MPVPTMLEMMDNEGSASHESAGAIVRGGGIVAFRTDTFYGLGVDPLNDQALQKLRDLKGREANQPILLLVADTSVVDRYTISRSELFNKVANHFWPGPITLIGAARPELPAELTSGTGTIGLRLPEGEILRELVRACGGALTATSANLSGHPPARTAQEVESYFPAGLDLIIDGGEVTVTQPSTVLDLSGADPCLIREGAISREELERLLGDTK